MSHTRAIIRPAARGDAEAIATIYNEAILETTATFDTETKTADERRSWLESHGDRHPVLVAELDLRQQIAVRRVHLVDSSVVALHAPKHAVVPRDAVWAFARCGNATRGEACGQVAKVGR